MKPNLTLACSLTLASLTAAAPPMGWNSWDAYGTTVREDQVKANAQVMASRLLKFGWNYVVVDIQWYEPSAQGHDYKPGARLIMDQYGRLVPAPNRFPSGFASLAAYLHGQGLKFGIHIMRGIPRQAVQADSPIWHSQHRAAEIADRAHVCEWNPDMYGIDMTKPGAQDYYDSLATLYASWGVDFIKADDMSRPYDQRQPEVRALSEALRKTGRSILLSLSPGPAPVRDAADLRKWANLWRISDDFWDDWKLLRQQFDFTRDWAPYIGAGDTWPDADMLPLGNLGSRESKFTPDERRTVMTLWSIFRSPLFFGGDLPTTDEASFHLITNPEVLAVNQHSAGNRQVYDHDNIRVWTAGGYVALFNLSEQPKHIQLDWTALGIKMPRP